MRKAVSLSLVLWGWLVANTVSASYPEPVLSYSPSYPVLNEYSVPGVCAPIHNEKSTVVTLRKGEQLASAIQRLHAESPKGGVLDIPSDAVTQCDSLRLSDKTPFPEGLTLRGIDGTDGKQARQYCRVKDGTGGKQRNQNYNLGGTVPGWEVPEAFVLVRGDKHRILHIENIHVDGYNAAIKYASNGTNVIRNSWFHHGPGNGISSGNTGGPGKNAYRGIEERSRFSLEACGLEISHYGQGNHTHNFYMHRGLGGGGDNTDWLRAGAFDTWSEVTIVDSFCHSPGWASCFKSTANKNNLFNNQFFSMAETDPSFDSKGKNAQMLIDTPACSINIIVGNKLHNLKPSKNSGGSAVIGFRGRRTAMRGCEIPLVYYPYTYSVSPVPLAKNPDHAIHTNEWWKAQRGRIWFPSIFKNNVVTVSGKYAYRQTAVELYGTYWIYEGPKKRNCFLDTPDEWYDRSRLYSSGNTFIGFQPGKIFKEVKREHHRNCVNTDPAGPGPGGDLYQSDNDRFI